MPQRLKVIGVVSLALFNLALLFLLNEKMSDSRVDSGDADLTRTTLTPATEAPPVQPGGVQGVAVAGDGAVFRYYSGSCDGKAGPGLSVATALGATFAAVDLPEDTRSILSFSARNADDLQLVDAGADCRPRQQVSSNGGAAWSRAKGVGVWFVHPGTGEVFSPRGKVGTGCGNTVTLGTVTSKRVRAFCASGTLVGSADTGRTWVRMGALDGAKAGAFPSADDGFALAPDGGCQARLFASGNRGQTWSPRGCLAGGPGRALATNGEVLAAVAGDSVLVSDDGGRNWSKAD